MEISCVMSPHLESQLKILKLQYVVLWVIFRLNYTLVSLGTSRHTQLTGWRRCSQRQKQYKSHAFAHIYIIRNNIPSLSK